MPKIQLREIAHARSGDKGDDANIGLIALKPEDYAVLVGEVTAERVKQHFAGICRGEVERFELPNLHALNFVLRRALDAGRLEGIGTRVVAAAAHGLHQTSYVKATKGRASFLGERSIGHIDPGACSSALLIGAVVRVLEEADTSA